MRTRTAAGAADPVRLVRGWGRSTSSHATVTRPAGDGQWRDLLTAAGPRGVIARGGGCAYGDAAQNAGGAVALTTGGSDVSRLLVEDGTVVADAGMTLGALISVRMSAR